jgi:hypothetical protein
MFCAPGLIFGCSMGIVSILVFCALGLVLDGNEGVGPIFHILRSRTRFGRYRGRRVPFSCFTLPDSFSAVPWTPGSVVVFCALGLVLGGTEGAGSSFHTLRSRSRFGQYRGPRFPFSCFVLPNSFWAIPRVSGRVFMFCTHTPVFGVTEGVRSSFQVLSSRTHLLWFPSRWVQFSCFALQDSFSAIPRVSSPFLMFSALRLFFDGT